MGIDYGTKRVGIALSDTEGRIAFPHAIVGNDKNLLQTIKNIIEKEGVQGVVIGESLDYKQKENPIMGEVKKLKVFLENESHLPVYFEPEILSSAEARSLLGRRENVDASAAAILLQSYLDRIKNYESRSM